MKICKECKKRKINKAFPVIIPGMFGGEDTRSQMCRECYAAKGESPLKEALDNMKRIFLEAEKKTKEITG